MRIWVAVIGDDYDELLAPYADDLVGSCREEFLQFVDCTEEVIERYHNDEVTAVMSPEGKLYDSGDFPFKSVDIGDGRRRLEKEVPEGYKEVTVKAKQLYKSLDDFARNRLGVQKDKSGRYGHICNPNAVWEHYDVSTGVFILKSDAPEGDAFEIGSASKEDDYEKLGYGACEREREDSARIEDIDFDRTRAKQGIFKTTAVITPDGKWYDRGHHPEMFTDENYFKNFIEPYPHETLTLIICKI